MTVRDLIYTLNQLPESDRDKNVSIDMIINSNGINKAKNFEIGTDAYVISSMLDDVSDEEYDDTVILLTSENNYEPDMSEL